MTLKELEPRQREVKVAEFKKVFENLPFLLLARVYRMFHIDELKIVDAPDNKVIFFDSEGGKRRQVELWSHSVFMVALRGIGGKWGKPQVKGLGLSKTEQNAITLTYDFVNKQRQLGNLSDDIPIDDMEPELVKKFEIDFNPIYVNLLKGKYPRIKMVNIKLRIPKKSKG